MFGHQENGQADEPYYATIGYVTDLNYRRWRKLEQQFTPTRYGSLIFLNDGYIYDPIYTFGGETKSGCHTVLYNILMKT